jgi:flagellar biogenesis protein FliO
LVSRAWDWIQTRRFARPSTRRLRVAETVSLGEKRFVAVVQVDGRHFLLAGGPTNIALLAQLDDQEPFEEVLKKTMTVPAKRPANTRQTVKRSTGQGALRVAKAVKKQTQRSATVPTEHYA